MKSQLVNELKVLQYCNRKKLKTCIDAVDYFEENGRAYLICKYFSTSLRDYLFESHGMSIATACVFLH